MILDDENKLVREIQNNAFEMMCCEKLGQIYMTKHGDLGYVWDIKPDGTPKIIMRTSSEYIKLLSLYEIEKSIKNFENMWYSFYYCGLATTGFTFTPWRSFNKLLVIILSPVFRPSSIIHLPSWVVRPVFTVASSTSF